MTSRYIVQAFLEGTIKYISYRVFQGDDVDVTLAAELMLTMQKIVSLLPTLNDEAMNTILSLGGITVSSEQTIDPDEDGGSENLPN